MSSPKCKGCLRPDNSVELADVSRFSASYSYVTVSPDTPSAIWVICPLFCVVEYVYVSVPAGDL